MSGLLAACGCEAAEEGDGERMSGPMGDIHVQRFRGERGGEERGGGDGEGR